MWNQAELDGAMSERTAMLYQNTHGAGAALARALADHPSARQVCYPSLPELSGYMLHKSKKL